MTAMSSISCVTLTFMFESKLLACHKQGTSIIIPLSNPKLSKEKIESPDFLGLTLDGIEYRKSDYTFKVASVQNKLEGSHVRIEIEPINLNT